MSFARVTKSEWFNRYKNSTYFDFHELSYMKGLNWRDISYCQNEIKQVLVKAKTSEEKSGIDGKVLLQFT